MKSTTLFSFGQSLSRRLRETGKIRTAETYEIAIRSFIRFNHDTDIPISEISASLIKDYEFSLIASGKTPNTISFYLRTLRTVLNHAAEAGIVAGRDIFKKRFTGMAPTRKRALSLESLRQLIALDLPKGSYMAFTRDVFLMSYLLRGMSLVDLAYLRKSDIKGGRLYYCRRKTGKPLSIEWRKEMVAIEKRYRRKRVPFLLPIITNPAEPLKSFRSASQRINRCLARISDMLSLPEKLTFYSARHTWASIAYHQGVPVSIISEGMGHSSEITTRIYLKQLDDGVIDNANLQMINLLG